MSMDTQAAMRLAVMLQKAAPKAMTSISPPARKTAVFSNPAQSSENPNLAS